MAFDSNKNMNFDSNEFELRHLLLFVYNHKNLIIRLSMIFGVVFALLSFTQPRLYTSQISLFKVNDFSTASMMGGLNIGSLMNSAGNVNNQLEVEITDVIKSKKIQNTIVNNQWETIDSSLIDFWEINQKSLPEKGARFTPKDTQREPKTVAKS